MHPSARVRIRLFTAIFVFLAGMILAPGAHALTIHLGYFEAGEQPLHYVLRDEFHRQLQNMAGADTQFVWVPNGYRSAEWVRDSSRIMAAELVNEAGVDLMVAIGPWVVEDLLAAGYRGPILGMRQIDPVGAGLLDVSGRPVASNLTVHEMPGKIEDDISVLRQLIPVKKLGVLWFDTGAEQDSIVARVQRLAEQVGFEAVAADGYNIHGTYAFFNAFDGLPRDVDAVYIGPTWGMTVTQSSEFFKLAAGRKIPLMTWEGRYHVTRGAFATNYAYGLVSEAHFNAIKALRIARGETPADLPVSYRGGSSLAINAGTARRVGAEVPADALLSGEVLGMEPPTDVDRYLLTDAVGRALQSHPSFLATYDAIEAAAQAAREAGAAYLPQVYVEGSVGWVDDHTLNNTIEPLKNQQYRASLVLNQMIFSPALLQARKVAARQTRLSKTAQRQARLDLELAVETAYLGHLRALEERGVEERYRELVERTLEYAASEFYLLGKGEPDLARWQDERQTVVTRVMEAENSVYTSRVLLNLLFNLPPERPIALDSGVVSGRSMGMDYEVLAPLAVQPERRHRFETFLIEQARATSPILGREDARLGLQEARLKASSAKRWPTVDLRAALYLVDEIDDDLGVIDEQTGAWSVYGRLRLPLYLGGARGKEQARLQASLSEIEFQRDGATLGVMADIRRETGQLITSVAALPRVGRSAELALHSMRLIIDEYEAGKRDMTAVLAAYAHAREAELAAISKRYEYLLAMARLVHAVGWSPSEGSRTFPNEFRLRAREAFAEELGRQEGQ